jgi:lipopolysaccharide biosynthesis glycosyltransferase
MSNIKFTFTSKNYERYTAALKAQVPDLRIEAIDIDGISSPYSVYEKAMEYKLLIPDYFNDGDKVIFIDSDVIVNKNLDGLFDMVSEELPFCVQRLNDIFNSGLYVVLINSKTREVYKRAMELYSNPTTIKIIVDEIYLCEAMKELGIKARYCDYLQCFETVIDPNCYINHFTLDKKQCETYQNFLNKVLKN